MLNREMASPWLSWHDITDKTFKAGFWKTYKLTSSWCLLGNANWLVEVVEQASANVDHNNEGRTRTTVVLWCDRARTETVERGVERVLQGHRKIYKNYKLRLHG